TLALMVVEGEVAQVLPAARVELRERTVFDLLERDLASADPADQLVEGRAFTSEAVQQGWLRQFCENRRLEPRECSVGRLALSQHSAYRLQGSVRDGRADKLRDHERIVADRPCHAKV